MRSACFASVPPDSNRVLSDEGSQRIKATPDEPMSIACTLATGEFKARVAWVADLNRDALRSCRRDDLRLELMYKPMAASRVRALAHREQECCAFLRFEVHEDSEQVWLTIDAPECARDVADTLFEQFAAQPTVPKSEPASEKR